MLTFISCAKTMTDRSRVSVPFTSEPHFAEEAKQNAMDMAQYSADDLSKVLRINQKLAAENYIRYHDFLSDDGKQLPALLSYTGMVFKRSADDLSKVLRINQKLAAENYIRYHDFLSDDGKQLPALLSYTGMVFKRIHPADFTPEDFSYAHDHLVITSFLYGLLRPLDLIRNYRMEGDVKWSERGGVTLFEYWKP